MPKLPIALLSILLLAGAVYAAVPNFVHRTLGIHAPYRKTEHVLFIGNSYTYVNDLPHMIQDVAASDPDNDIGFETEIFAQGGIHLSESWSSGALDVLHSRHWDYVVLQEQSVWAMLQGEIQNTFDAGGKFAAEIRKGGAVPLLYLTWIRKPGSSWYTDPQYASTFSSPQNMQSRFHQYTYTLAARTGATVVPAGDIWDRVAMYNSAINLYAEDGSHPAVAGTYLVALTFYHYLTGHSVQGVRYIPSGVSAVEAAALKEAVSRYADK